MDERGISHQFGRMTSGLRIDKGLKSLAKYLSLVLAAFSFACGALVATWNTKGQTAHKTPLATHDLHPRSIVICGIRDHPCVSYTVSYHEPTRVFGDGPGEAFTDYEAKTIVIAWSKDPVQNVQALAHEVYHAALWERGLRDEDKWDLHSWIYLSEGAFSMALHDNPELMRYIADGY